MMMQSALPLEQKAAYLRTLPAIRERCGRVHDLAKAGKLQYFDYHPEKEPDAANFCVELIQRDFNSYYSTIPPHGRWSHLDAGKPRVEPLIARWKASPNPPDTKEVTRRLVDLFVVSVLLDAGAGSKWSYHESGGGTYSRSEGLGVASIHMFESGFFSGDPKKPHQVDATGLSKITSEAVAVAMQVSDTNPMIGIEGRATLLKNLADALKSNPLYFGDHARPGNMLDFLESESIPGPSRRIHVSVLWSVLIEGLALVWPKTRTKLGDIFLGDVWPCPALRSALTSTEEGGDLVPFHKLTGWMTYSLIVPIEKILGWKVEGIEDLVGLPEYRNGGLLVDFGVLTLRSNMIEASYYPDPASPIPRLPAAHPAIVEWRAMTVIELDRIAQLIRDKLGIPASQLTLPQVLESATWKGGREIAKTLRPETAEPPIDIESDGTVF
ncbi:DUF1688-domain-containing protein [Punctularia strigosozonata HHB-11173 SS5]|uniref:DUF1688-domain-containing protein n=1 Tax=Punctularia strigosozonata (strain HHB-11173) TaxID=741275 RepID=UPI0004417E4E|nr:DUF1688-domain-containing protein [Punctularia strigosozonata HHB-11173 SS5]EIN14439.1 DUF1688-domain-containing protein [Punctularia strigosozonata HHB-11173 SS5]